MHPAVAPGEHFDKLAFHLLPIVVAPQEQRFDGLAEDWVGLADRLKRLAGGAAVEVVGLIGDAEAAAEAGEQRLLEGQVAAEGVDSGDAELRGQVEELPAKQGRAFEGKAGEGGRSE